MSKYTMQTALLEIRGRWTEKMRESDEAPQEAAKRLRVSALLDEVVLGLKPEMLVHRLNVAQALETLDGKLASSYGARALELMFGRADPPPAPVSQTVHVHNAFPREFDDGTDDYELKQRHLRRLRRQSAGLLAPSSDA